MTFTNRTVRSNGIEMAVRDEGQGPAVVLITRCGHWTQQEKPDELNALMVDWLRRRFGVA